MESIKATLQIEGHKIYISTYRDGFIVKYEDPALDQQFYFGKTQEEAIDKLLKRNEDP